jgi:hypothetical protein
MSKKSEGVAPARIGEALKSIERAEGLSHEWAVVREVGDEIAQTLDGRAPTWPEQRILRAAEKIKAWLPVPTEPAPEAPETARQAEEVERLRQLYAAKQRA